MPLTRLQKQKILEDLKDKIARQKAMVFVDFTGLKVKDLSVLKKKLKAADDELKVAKKTLLGMALKSSGFEIKVKEFKGEIAAAFGYKDEISPAKIVYQFAQANPNLKILGGFFEGKIKSADEVIELAQLSSKEELLARLVGSIKAPVSNFVYALNYNLKGLVYIISKAKPSL